MSAPNDGGPAFPCQGYAANDGSVVPLDGISGMSLRDYFAAKAMAAVITMDGATVDGERLAIPANAETVASAAYAMADAMLAARTTGEQS